MMTSLVENISDKEVSTENNSKLPGYKLALITTAFAAVVVLLGAFTRLSDAGLGCPDWPGCYGHLLWPNSSEEILVAESKFPHAPVETEKAWPEMVHRYFAGTIGLLIVGLVSINFKHRNAKKQPVKLAVSILLLVILQGAFGMWTVTLKLWPQVVTAHLLGGFATLSLLWLLSLRSNFPINFPVNSDSRYLQKLKSWVIIALMVLIAQIFLGGWTSSNYAALACLDFPTCHGGEFFPVADYAKGFDITQHIGPNYLGGQLEGEARTAIHITHRIGAVITTVVIGVLSLKLIRSSDTLLIKLGFGVASILAAQVLLGISNVVFYLPLPVAVAHNGCAALLLMSLITVCYVVYSAQTMDSKINSPTRI